jgi:hypothetical protein
MRSQWGRTSFFVACPPPLLRASAFSAVLFSPEVHALARVTTATTPRGGGKRGVSWIFSASSNHQGTLVVSANVGAQEPAHHRNAFPDAGSPVISCNSPQFPPRHRVSAFSAALVHQEVHAPAHLTIWRALLNISAATGNLTPFLTEVSQ